MRVDRSFKEKNIYWVRCMLCDHFWRVFTPDKNTIDIKEYQK